MMRRSPRVPPRAHRAGMTLLEVVVAVAVIGIIAAILTTAIVGSMKTTRRFGGRTEAAQLMNFLGRRVAGGETALLPQAGTPLAWAYGQVGTAFPDLRDAGGFTDPARYRASVQNMGEISASGATVTEYRVSVCFQDNGGESCVAGTTLSSPPSAPVDEPPLPGIN